MSPSRDFDEDVSNAAHWEKRIAEKIRTFMFRKYSVRMIPYDNLKDIERQRNGMDFIIKSEEAGWEIKTRSPDYYLDGILLETISVVERNKLGWLYTCKADCIAYVWRNWSFTNLMPIGYFIMIKELRKTLWYDEAPRRYENPRHKVKSDRKNSEGKIISYWWTKFIVPPIEDFPPDILVPFNAILPSNHKQKNSHSR